MRIMQEAYDVFLRKERVRTYVRAYADMDMDMDTPCTGTGSCTVAVTTGFWCVWGCTVKPGLFLTENLHFYE